MNLANNLKVAMTTRSDTGSDGRFACVGILDACAWVEARVSQSCQTMGASTMGLFRLNGYIGWAKTEAKKGVWCDRHGNIKSVAG